MHMNSPSQLTILDIYTMKLSLPISLPMSMAYLAVLNSVLLADRTHMNIYSQYSYKCSDVVRSLYSVCFSFYDTPYIETYM